MRRLLMIELSWALSRAFTKFGIAIAASNPMMATTIMISTRVNPAFLFVLICISDLSVLVCSNARREQRGGRSCGRIDNHGDGEGPGTGSASSGTTRCRDQYRRLAARVRP